jgi:hypothetical protein
VQLVQQLAMGWTAEGSRLVLRPIQPPIQWILRDLSLGVKQPGHEADPSPPTSAVVKNMGTYISTPPNVFMA